MKQFKFIATPKLIGYLIKFVMRLTAFGIMLFLYIRNKSEFYAYTVASPKNGINFMHIMWAVFMILILLHLFPSKITSMGASKSKKSNYFPIPEYSETELLKFIHNENIKAWRCMICWIFGNAVIGILYYCKLFGKSELLLITGFYFISDYICILIFCPFQTFGQKSRCCINCRIYDWGHFFMFTPMLLIDTFYSRSLFFMGAAVIIRWEIIWTNHPERFWYGSNQTLSCCNCRDKTCQIKRQIKKSAGHIIRK